MFSTGTYWEASVRHIAVLCKHGGMSVPERFSKRMPSEEECGTTETSFAKAREEQREKW